MMGAANEGAKSVPGSLTIGILPDGKASVSRYADVAIVTDLGQRATMRASCPATSSWPVGLGGLVQSWK